MSSAASEELRALIEYLARALVDLPDQVNVKQIEGEQTTVIELKVAKEDLGKVIGKQGRTAYAMDSLKRAMKWDEEKYGREYDLDVFNIVAVSAFNFGAMENKIVEGVY